MTPSSKWITYGILLCLLCLSSDTYASMHQPGAGYTQIMTEALSKYRRFDNAAATRKWVDAVGGAFRSGGLGGPQATWSSALKAASLADLTPDCANASAAVVSGFKRGDMWALSMLDAMAKPSSGILQGNMLWPGSYSECVGIQAAPTPSGSIHGQHCLVFVKNSSDPMPTDLEMESSLLGLHVGVCIPDVCTVNDSMVIVDLALQPLQPYLPGIQSAQSYCRTSKRPPLDGPAIGVISMLSVIGAVLLVATIYDVIVIRGLVRIPAARDPLGVRIVDEDEAGSPTEPPEEEVAQYTSFHINDGDPALAALEGHRGWFAMICMRLSMYTNALKLLSTKQGPGSLRCIHGIRFLSMTWVILGHTYALPMTTIVNLTDMIQAFRGLALQVILNASVSVDTFFLLSGTLVSYLLLKELQRNEGPRFTNWGKFYFHRFWRLTPPYMILLGVNAALSKYFAEGPFWPESTGLDPTCTNSWWANLLYINNLTPNHEYCFGWAWYLANDMQFFVISPIFVIALYLNNIVGVILCLLMILGSSVGKGVMLYITHCEAESAQVLDGATCGQVTQFDNYAKPWYRIGPYVVGLLLGYVLFVTNRKVSLKWYTVIVGWATAAGVALSLLYGLYGAAQGHPLSFVANAIYGALERPLWGAAVAWVIFACVCGYGGPVNKLLSWAPLVPLSRLTYMTYLIHPMVIITYSYSRQAGLLFSNSTMVMNFLAFLTASYGLAFFGSLVLEAPMLGLEKVVFRSKRD